ncbi:CFA/I fimbrial chaperone [Klebsiella pneumoniae]|uniref:CFA/I fimbrial chaperone n=1 Tax=Klebsiella pneumoniae TaxID=573 RepID=A0A377TPN0_KLEPN|nr:CFA/I fimbrial chaperone [Klebsiella pneumoniae]
MEPVVVMDTILVVRPREVQFKWSSIRWPDGEQHRQYLV